MCGEASPWWADGLFFSCLSCGKCCGGEPGTVSFTSSEEEAMADALDIGVPLFRSLYVWRKYGVPSLRERANYDCVFLEREPCRCGIYGARPSQCRTFPFWREILRNERSWARFASKCPGMNQGSFHGRAEIWERLRINSTRLMLYYDAR